MLSGEGSPVGKWVAVAKQKGASFEIAVVRDDNDLGKMFYGWFDLNARQASAFRPGKESAKPVRASSGATDQSAAVAQEHQPCELFPIASA